MIGGSYLKASRGSENFEPAYTATLGLASNSLRDYTVTRKRSGLNAAFDWKAGASTTLHLRGLYNRFSDQEYRQQVKHTVTSSRIDRQLKDRLETQHIGSFAARGLHAFAGGATLEVRASTAYGDEGEPNHQDTTFRQGKVLFNPNVTAASIDPNNIQANPLNENLANYTLNSIVITDGLTRDRDAVASGDLRLPLTTSAGNVSFLKFGGKYRQKHKFYDVTITNKTSPTAIPMQPYLDSTTISIFGTRYPMGPPINAAGSRGISSQYPLTSVPDHIKADPANYDATEGVFAAYGMAEIFLGTKLALVPGVRFESTNVDYTGHVVKLDASGAWVSTSEVTGGATNGVVLPMAHLRYAFDDSTILRTAFTRTLARPDYADLVPRETINLQNYTISQGNPALQPTTSWNYDLMFEHYFRSVGIVSAGFFAKQLTDYIYPFESTDVRGGDTYRVTQPQNGESATLRGAEFAFQNQLRFLPGPLAGIGVYANYTFTTSSTTFLGREGETAPLPGQARHVGNFAVWYERYGFSGRASVNYHGRFLDSVGATSANDVFYDAHEQLDVMLSQAIGRNFRVFADFLNLSDAPLRYYQAVWDRPIQEERYHWWCMFGVKATF
jgi:TonB-dependent receptor